MSIESKGPGNVGNSYGSRGTNTPRQYDTAGVLKPDYQEFGERGIPSAVKDLVAGAGKPPFTSPPVTVCVGNSVPGFGWYSSGAFLPGSEVMYTQIYSGNRLRFKPIAANTAPPARHDAYGTYSYSGAQLTTMNNDFVAAGGWIESLVAKGLVPDLLIAVDLLINDIRNGISLATITLRLEAFERIVRAQWPNIVIWYWHGRNCADWNTTAELQMLDDTLAWMAARSDQTKNFYTDLRLVWGTNPGAPDTGTTDLNDNTHPGAYGAQLTAARTSDTLTKIVSSTRRNGLTVATQNPYMTGSGTAPSGTGNSGTVAAGYGASTACGSGNLVAYSASFNKTRMTITCGGTTNGVGLLSAPNLLVGAALPDTTRVVGVVRVTIISGAQFLGGMEPSLVLTHSDASTLTGKGIINSTTATKQPTFTDGQVLYLTVPDLLPTPTKTLAQCYVQLTPFLKTTAGSGTVVIDVDQMGACFATD